MGTNIKKAFPLSRRFSLIFLQKNLWKHNKIFRTLKNISKVFSYCLNEKEFSFLLSEFHLNHRKYSFKDYGFFICKMVWIGSYDIVGYWLLFYWFHVWYSLLLSLKIHSHVSILCNQVYLEPWITNEKQDCFEECIATMEFRFCVYILASFWCFLLGHLTSII